MAEEILLQLQSLVEPDMPKALPVKEKLIEFANEVKAGGPDVREDMLELGAYKTILRAWSLLCYSGVTTAKLFSPDATSVREASLKALYSLTAGFPEIIDQVGWVMIRQAVDYRVPETTQTLAMKVVRNICIKSEQNREHIVWEMDLLAPLVLLIKRDKPSAEFVREWCGAMITLTLTDDIRVAYNRAPERKRIIHQHNVLPILARHLQTYDGDEATVNSLVVLLGNMAVNEDMCIAIESGNVFPPISRIFKMAPQNKTLIKNTLSLLRYLNVAPTVREKCASNGLVKWVLQLMLQQKDSEDVLEVGLSSLAFMTLRDACQVGQLLVAGGVQTIFEFVKQCPENIQIMKAACLTLRNVAANGCAKAQTTILDLGGAEILQQIQENFPDLKHNYVKPVLRELGLATEESEELPSHLVPGTDSVAEVNTEKKS